MSEAKLPSLVLSFAATCAAATDLISLINSTFDPSTPHPMIVVASTCTRIAPHDLDISMMETMTSPWYQWSASGQSKPGLYSDYPPPIPGDDRFAQVATPSSFSDDQQPSLRSPSSLVYHRGTPSSSESSCPIFSPGFDISRALGPVPTSPRYDIHCSSMQSASPRSERSDDVLSRNARTNETCPMAGTTAYFGAANLPPSPNHLPSPAIQAAHAIASTPRPTWSAKSSRPLSHALDEAQSLRQQSRSSMAVRSLLNDDPPPLDPTYSLCIRQQPANARSCGLGDRDRRVVDPPPILELKIDAPWLSRQEISRRLRTPSYVVHCSIWSPDGEEDMSGMPDDYTRQKRLMGNMVASPFVGCDELGQEGCFFCFPDISCRTPGRYRLKFVLVVLEWPLRPRAKSMIRAELLSDVFQTFSAKDFPGMLESSPLAKALKHQGCNIPTKKGNDRLGRRYDSDDISGGDEAPRKRTRKASP